MSSSNFDADVLNGFVRKHCYSVSVSYVKKTSINTVAKTLIPSEQYIFLILVPVEMTRSNNNSPKTPETICRMVSLIDRSN